ncbi:glycosyl hydrolase [Flavilitoribacter nigricans DSM 23189 = NBRC 102662]|uniref:Glycosyl hydrolase n=2 Tax=Flavilitoribacter TaxID=2762562 RepID=A0A2D0N1T1_FLAN2|nr:glycosyl hydrolase [Flavilitoribacter nigricans DSM 23189 = NBRC 102662]
MLLPELTGQNLQKEALAEAVSGLQLRSIGPALMGGRLADIAVHPVDRSTWYVAVGSGGLWKTTNSGISWKPVFDDQPSYSIGTVTIDPGNPEMIWVGTGENVSGRHVGWGSGVYLSRNGGRSWQNMGLEQSEHISRILVDPRNSDVVFVAAEGPLWASGGDRGLYKTEDGGKTWQQVLEIDPDTGVTDVEFDPSNPDVLYAAAYQRRRHTWSLLAGGPQSGIYKSTDNGATWRRISTGLPGGDMGKIGLAVTPADPQLVYATIEANGAERGFYRSADKGESWERRNSYISGGTGPHYYQEIEASPVNPDLVYQMDVFLHVTRDGGKTFNYLGTGREKHSDNHALWIDPRDGEHFLCGTDAGLYETFDEGTTWRHFPNLPVSQFYKIDLDAAEPFYNIVAGAQDLGTLIGPSRTTNVEGVRNRDWYVPLGADGYDTAFDPSDPNTVYMQTQQGNLHRHDRRSEEGLNIQPQPEPNDPPERWNWDSPILVSPHNTQRLYFGSQRLWRSDDRGNSWAPISGDLTTNRNRYELEMMGRVWSADALYDNGAMSQYATLTGISESPRAEGVIYVGSDDGRIQVTEDGGANWRPAAALPRVPPLSFINDVEASRHDANTVFAIADAHKLGDYHPYLFKSTDRGRSWRSISGDLPENTIVWVIKQDHLDPDLLFIGTEYGIYFSPNGGTNWIELGGGVPTIPFRDLELHERDNDLVGASFGRGIYILDDYSALRDITKAVNDEISALFPVRDAWWYVPYEPMQAKGMPTLGTTSFVTENPPFGAVFTYYLPEVPMTLKQERQKDEKALQKQNADIPFPGWERLREEAGESAPRLLLSIRQANGDPVRWIEGTAGKGVHRLSWDLRYPASDPISLSQPDFVPPWAGASVGPLVAPGSYTAELFLMHDGDFQSLGTQQEFIVKPVSSLPDGTDVTAVAEFQQQTNELSRKVSIANREIGQAREKMRYMRAALLQTPKATPELFSRLDALGVELTGLQTRLSGDRIRQSMNEATAPSISSRVGQVAYGHWNTRQTPTETHKRLIRSAETDFAAFRDDLTAYFKKLADYGEALQAAGAPWTPGR